MFSNITATFGHLVPSRIYYHIQHKLDVDDGFLTSIFWIFFRRFSSWHHGLSFAFAGIPGHRQIVQLYPSPRVPTCLNGFVHVLCIIARGARSGGSGAILPEKSFETQI